MTGGRVTVSSEMIDTAEDLRQLGLAKVRENAVEESIELFDRALAVAGDDEARELISINKAYSLLRMEKSGPEVQLLPRIVMRRGNLRHVVLAAYGLQRKFVTEKDYRKASSYARIALEAAGEIGNDGWKAAALVTLGNIAVFDSRSEEAIEFYVAALPLLSDSAEDSVTRAIIAGNVGYCRLLSGDTEGGVSQIHCAVDLLFAAGAEGHVAEPYIDLCMGYLEKGELEKARHFGELGLEKSTEVRQVRNAHYLLGEIAYKSGDTAKAEFHFDHLATHYPDFPHLKNLLFAIDLRKMVNFKL